MSHKKRSIETIIESLTDGSAIVFLESVNGKHAVVKRESIWADVSTQVAGLLEALPGVRRAMILRPGDAPSNVLMHENSPHKKYEVQITYVNRPGVLVEL